MKREKNTGPTTDPCKTPRQTQFVILENHIGTSIRREGLSSTSNARREASSNEVMEKSRMPDKVKSFREIDSRKDRLKAWPGFVKPIQNGLRKVQNLI